MRDKPLPDADSLERTAAEHMKTAPAQAIAGLLHAAEAVRDSEALRRTMKTLTALAEDMGHIVAERQAEAARRVRSFLIATSPDEALRWRRIKFGGQADDAGRWPDRWISYQCAGMLCSFCTSDEHDLQCTCPHHEKTRR